MDATGPGTVNTDSVPADDTMAYSSLAHALKSESKHAFVLSWAGRPIFSRFGADDSALAAFSGVISALIHNVESLDNHGEISFIECNGMRFVFCVKGPVYLLTTSSESSDSTKLLLAQLDIIYLQIVMVLSESFVEILNRKPNYDVRNLLTGSEELLLSLISRFDHDPSFLLEAVPCLRLKLSLRTAMGLIMHDSAKDATFGLLIAGGKLVTLVRPKRHALHPVDLLLLINFVTNTQALRKTENWLPICLPKLSPGAYFYAHTCYLATDVCLVLLSSDSSGFYKLQHAKNSIHTQLESSGYLDALTSSLSSSDVPRKDFTATAPELREFLYKSDKLSQFVRSHSEFPYDSPEQEQHLFNLFKRMHNKVHEPKVRQLVYYEKYTNEVLLAWIDPGHFEFYGVFSSDVNKEQAVLAVSRTLRHIIQEEKTLFVLSSPTSKSK